MHIPYAGDQEEGLNRVPFLCSCVLQDFGFDTALLKPDTLWIMFSDCFSLLPLATVAILLLSGLKT